MLNFFTRSLRNNLIALFLIVSIIPIAVIGFLSYNNAKNSLEEAAFSKLAAVAETKANALTTFFSVLTDEIKEQQARTGYKSRFQALEQYKNDQTNPEYIQVKEWLVSRYNQYSDVHPEFEQLFLVDTTGEIVYVSTPEEKEQEHVGKLLDEEIEAGYSLFDRGKEGIYLTDILYHEEDDEIEMVLVAPVHLDGEFIGLVGVEVNTELIDTLLEERTGLGETGETYLVGADYLMRSNSRFETESTVLKKKVDTENVRACFLHMHMSAEEGEEMEFTNYRGVTALGAYVYLPELNWALIAEIDGAEAFAPVAALRTQILLIALGIALVVAAIAYFMARGISNPIRKVSEQMGKVAAGDLSAEVSSDSRADEVGVLGQSFRVMVENLRGQIRDISEAVSVLASSVNQLRTSTAQLNSSATETAATVSETTTTAEEIKQTAEVASEKAKHVSESAQGAVQVAESGKKSTDNTIEATKRIKEQMESIANSVVRLSEQTQAIGAIIATVDDLAAQSNLLAVNASIEAARAGEEGKGFAVVAQEIKNLAEQSKGATAQVRIILTDFQKATSTLVMATEQGNKAVEAGENQSIEAGESILNLADSVDGASQAAIQIAASSQQQLLGMDQMAEAMENIKQAAGQNVDAAQQLDTLAQNLDELGQRLKQLVEQYKV